jgi:hypothetical protein
MRKERMTRINQFVCHLFVYLLLNLLLFSFLVMRPRRMIRGVDCVRIVRTKFLISSLYIDHNCYHAFIYLVQSMMFIYNNGRLEMITSDS